MHRPRIKRPHRPSRSRSGRIRIGGLVPGIGRDLLDPGGWVWTLLGLLDGSRSVEEVVAVLTSRFDGLPGVVVRAAVDDLMAAGYVEDADEPDSGLAPAARERHSRGRELLQWMDPVPRRTGWDTQRLLAHASVALVGVGGAGCVTAENLVLSGVGRLHCVDGDVVERSNLNRQPLYDDADIGQFKTDVAVRKLRAANPAVDVTGERHDVDGPAFLGALVERFDVVVLAADRPGDIRSWTNRACLATGTPWVHVGYHGPLVSVGLYRPGTGPCSDCLRTVKGRERTPGQAGPPPGPSDVQAANATSAGLAGHFAAHAAASLITGVPALPVNREYAFNLVTLASVPVRVLESPDPECPACRPPA
ncbi:ThiF family adenylyltransferase [Amycolatopsis sp. Hca4]|uniref:ThiF family adenylyltransferase n=1 Tax=Amycolatopsis sp. Hca4 TaxID=2742131 RepID=UPI0015929947|nr:ThiF family adenylyltransferase [Amycolatopsis sp. Hca4]QKV80643.1 ThiF family adenylyltransferase [Amycolatopsis sp. Hca4]